MNKILDLKKIKEAKVNKEAFPFFSVSNVFLNNKITKDLTKDFPEILKGGSFPSESLTAGPSFKKLIEELESKELKQLLESKFNINLSNSSVVTTVRGISRKRDGKIHSDSKTKLVTVLIYLNEGWEKRTGLLRMLKDSSNIENFLYETPATMGSLIAFKVEPNCWHGYLPYIGKRKSIQLNYLNQDSLLSHRARHKISFLIKKFSSKLGL